MAGKRMLYKNICTSEKINQLSDEAENLYYRLLVNVDDLGRFFGNPVTVKDMCYPMKNVTPFEVGLRLDQLSLGGLIHRYEVNNVSYVEVEKFSAFQILRKDIKKRADFPAPKRTCNEPVTDTKRICSVEVKVKVKDKVKGEVKGKVKGKVKLLEIPAKAGTPQAEFVDNWKALYKFKTGHDYKANQKDFVLIAGLLKKYSAAIVLEKAKLLFQLCNNGGAWFAKSMADFTIGNLSSHWNSIIEEVKDHGRQAGVSKSEIKEFMADRK